VVMDIQRVIKSPIATTQEVAAAIEKDAVISLRLIATANSPLYRGAKKVLTVREAVPRLGIKQTQSIVNAIANRGLYETTNEEFTALMQRLWLHALASAYTARAIAKLTKRDDYEIYFTYGLVHDIGKVLLVRAALEKMQRGVADMTTDTILPLIQNAHTEIGALLLERWGFPEQFKNAALLHENDSYSEATPHEVLVVNLANLLTRSFGCSLFSSDENTSAAYPAAQLLKIEMAALQSIAAEVKSIMHDSPTLF
ncbi:MAG: HDOD domain-containing protein, partial [Desulfobacterota bacterium]|nr:HDOD domain-containing protein [Thermodesulfobacteriota bacterium]